MGNWETSALRSSGNVAPQYFETGWVTTTLLVLGGLKVALLLGNSAYLKVATTLLVLGGLKADKSPTMKSKSVRGNNPPSTGWVERKV